MEDQMTGAPYEFDRGVAVRRLGDGAWSAELEPGWAIGGAVNGGYVLAVVGNAIRAELADLGQPDPFTISAYYLTPCLPGPAIVRLRVIRSGGRRSTVAATLVQEQDGAEVERLTVLAVFGHLDAQPGEVLREMPPAELPPREECFASRDSPEEVQQMAAIMQRFDTRFDPAHVGWAVGEPSGAGRVQAWLKLADDRPLDPIALLLVVDALPPATFDLGLMGWAPTLELTVHVRANPAPGWAIVRHASRNISGGHFEEDCEVWDSTGRLVAQSRQLALLPR